MTDRHQLLDEYLESVRSKPFTWGTHDCMTFANDCVRVQRGLPFADDWTGGYRTAKQCLAHYLRKLRSNNRLDIIDAIDHRLSRIRTTLPPRGSIIAKPVSNDEAFTGYALGVVVSDLAAFVGPKGLVFMPVQERDIFWSIHPCLP
jgi:hypothetical protein